MRFHTSLVSILPMLLLVAACGEPISSPDAETPSIRSEILGSATLSVDCQAQIEALAAATAIAPITGKNAEKDRAGLLGKVTAASSDLTAGKNADAVLKLGDFVAKVEQLKAAGKLNPVAADQLIADANEAIACITMIGG